MSPDHRLVFVDAAFDAQSMNRAGRYASYLHSRAHQFHEDGAALEPPSFAIMCWQVATSPVMSPGYVQWRRDITTVKLRHTEEWSIVVADVEVRLPWPAEIARGPRTHDLRTAGWRDWDREWFGDLERPPLRFEPRQDDKPALLTTAHLLVPIHVSALPKRQRPEPWLGTRPRYQAGEVDVDDAKHTITTICALVNEQAGPVVDELRTARS